MSTLPPKDIVDRFKYYGQDHVFAFWDELSPDQRECLLNDADSVDLPKMNDIIQKSSLLLAKNIRISKTSIEPVPKESISTVEERPSEERERWRNMGLKSILEGKLAVLLLSGGQGTRLGSTDPKGCFNIGLPSGKSLFQLQAERILYIQRIAMHSACNGKAKIARIHWYIMTSSFTNDATHTFFENHKYFGLQSDQITFFQQGTLPCISENGKFIMESPYRIAKAPDGNGGVYTALKSLNLLEDMAKKGVQYVDCYCVDNALVRVADPTFLGYFIEKGVAAASKVVCKAYPQEKVGVFAQQGKDGSLCVIEYSEMDMSLACSINQETGHLHYCWSNVCLHMFTLDFLLQVAGQLGRDCIFHWAKKKIPSIHGFTIGFKLEQFIFDALAYAPSACLFEVLRDEEFAPVKDANGASLDTPEIAKMMLLRLHSRWVIAAGGFITPSMSIQDSGVEVSPLCSYAGENLEALCHGRTFHAPCEITPQTFLT